MDICIHPRRLRGEIAAIPSKSQAHRLLISAAFADRETTLICPETNRDIEATAACLRALGADIRRTDTGYTVLPIRELPRCAVLPCSESGSTLRFLLPVAGALGVDATFTMEGRLPARPLSPLWEEMVRMGCTLTRPTENTIRCRGRLQSGLYTIDGGVSSQFITGLLFALPHLPGCSEIRIVGVLQSRPYVDMTMQAMAAFGVHADGLRITGSQRFRSPGVFTVEGDWSNAAFFLAASALGSGVHVTNLNETSAQGDRAIARLLTVLNSFRDIDAADIPDLVPILAVAAGAKAGARFTNIARLRLKESDRVASVAAMIRALGGSAEETADTLTIYGGTYRGGMVDACNDHRIAMAAAIAATISSTDVIIHGAECTAKSYPRFWEAYQSLGGSYEQYIR